MDDNPHHGVEEHIEVVEGAVVVEGEGLPVLHAGTASPRAWRRGKSRSKRQ